MGWMLPQRRYGTPHDTVLVESLKVLDPKRPIREADIAATVAAYPFGAPAEDVLPDLATGARTSRHVCARSPA
jgi:hypothetical protein